MMYIFFYKEGQQVVRSVHVGESIPKAFKDVKTAHEEVNFVEAVQADCDELQQILCTCVNLPYKTSGRVQTWRGDFAKFIVDNWSWKD